MDLTDEDTILYFDTECLYPVIDNLIYDEIYEIYESIKIKNIKDKKRLITYSNLKKRRANGEIIKPVNNYKMWFVKVK